MTYGPILAGLAVKTLKFAVADYVVDHYAAVGPDDARAAFAGTNASIARAQQASKALLLEIALAQVNEFPVIQRTGGLFSPKITRIVIRMTDGALLLVALKGSVEDAAAKVLADQIADALWRTPPRVVMLPDPSHYIGPANLDGLGVPLPQPIYAVRGIKRRRVFHYGRLI